VLYCLLYVQLAGAVGDGLVSVACTAMDHQAAAVCPRMGRSDAKQVRHFPHPSIQSVVTNRLNRCLENLEILGNFTDVMEMSGISVKIRKSWGENTCQKIARSFLKNCINRLLSNTDFVPIMLCCLLLLNVSYVLIFNIYIYVKYFGYLVRNCQGIS